MVEVHNGEAGFWKKSLCGQSLPVTRSLKRSALCLDQTETGDLCLIGRSLTVLKRPFSCLGIFQHSVRIWDVISLRSGDSILLCHALVEPALGGISLTVCN